ncbi:hypothetical protein D3C81_385930 [compost metagenome]
MLRGKQLFIHLGLLLAAFLLPVAILKLLFIIFSEFYTKGFMTGLGQALICILMIAVNVITMIMSSERIQDGKIKDVKKYILLVVFFSVFTQITLSLIIENPFIDPPTPHLF